MELRGLAKIIEEKASETHMTVKEEKKVQPQTLDALVGAVKDLNESSGEITHVDRSNIQKAITSLSELQVLINSIKKNMEAELEETARDEVIAQLSHIPVKDMIRDLKEFLRTGKKVAKTYKPKT